MRKTEEGIKGYLTPGALFEELGLRYIGPIDGHNLDELIRTFRAVKKMNTPVLVHVYTCKGKGSKLAEEDAVKYYSIGGKAKQKVENAAPDYSNVFGQSIIQLAEKDDKVVCITAAMEIGTGMTPFIEKYPDKKLVFIIAGDGPQKKIASTFASNDWIFSLDSDERCTIEVRDEIIALIDNAPLDIYQ